MALTLIQINGMPMKPIAQLVLASTLLFGAQAHAENWTLIGETAEKTYIYADKDSVRKNGDIGKITIRTPERYLLTWEFDCDREVMLEQGQHTPIGEDPSRRKAYELTCRWFSW